MTEAEIERCRTALVRMGEVYVRHISAEVIPALSALGAAYGEAVRKDIAALNGALTRGQR